MFTSTMEGVCALRHGWRTFRRPGTERARVQHPLEYRCAVPSRTKTDVATACCAGVSAWHGPGQEHFSAQRDEPCTSQEFRLELARRHDPRRAVGAQLAECPVRPPRARCRAGRLRASAPARWCSVSTPACAGMHRRTAVRVPSPHVAGMYAASSPPHWRSAVGYSVSLVVPPRVLVLCASPLRVPRTAPSTAPRRSVDAHTGA